MSKDLGKVVYKSSTLESIWVDELLWAGCGWSASGDTLAMGANKLVLETYLPGLLTDEVFVMDILYRELSPMHLCQACRGIKKKLKLIEMVFILLYILMVHELGNPEDKKTVMTRGL